MSIATELSRIQADRNAIRAKLVELGMATNTDNLDALAAAIESLVNRGAVKVEVKEGESYTIPAGYHNGNGVVSGVAGGGNYTLQAKTATPTKKQQAIAPDSGYYGLSGVTVEAIPDAYQDVTSVTTEAGDVLTGKIFVDSEGTVITGTMTNNGAVTKTLDVTTVTFTIPKGYHSGTGKVTIALEEKIVTPTKAAQTITPTNGKVLSKVTVNAIPDEYITTDDADAVAEHILVDETAYVDGEKVTGTMPNNGTVNKTLTASDSSFAIAEGYHDGTGSVKIVPESKSVTPTKAAQTVSPTTGKVLSTVEVAAIPGNFIDTTDADALAAEILLNKTAYVNTVKVTGTMPNNGAADGSIDGLTNTSVTIPAGYTTGGTVALTSDIEDALSQI